MILHFNPSKNIRVIRNLTNFEIFGLIKIKMFLEGNFYEEGLRILLGVGFTCGSINNSRYYHGKSGQKFLEIYFFEKQVRILVHNSPKMTLQFYYWLGISRYPPQQY